METKHLIENLIFVSGEPISIKKLSQILEIEEGQASEAIKELKEDIKNRGLRIIEKDGKVQMVTAPEAGSYVEKFIGGNLKEDLSEAALETLAAISYLGPVSKYEIEDLRGVNCAFTLRNLLIRGLIERVENPSNSRITLYKTSFDFLKKMGVEKEDDLPDYEKHREEIRLLMDKNKKMEENNANTKSTDENKDKN